MALGYEAGHEEIKAMMEVKKTALNAIVNAMFLQGSHIAS
jgi:hypothetical protein